VAVSPATVPIWSGRFHSSLRSKDWNHQGRKSRNRLFVRTGYGSARGLEEKFVSEVKQSREKHQG